MTERRRRPTSTSNFGVSRREGHDASAFYGRFEVPDITTDETIGATSVLDVIHAGSSSDMSAVADNSVALVVTSPPYYAGKAYEEEIGQGHIPGSYLEYLQMLEAVFAECIRVLEPGGRIAVNVANLGRRPYRSLSGDVTAILQDRLKLLLRGEIIWVKARGAGGNCAWGSFQQPGNPVLRDLSERIIVASKGRFDRARRKDVRAAQGLPSAATIFRDEFLDFTTDVWEFPPESASRIGHPAPYPVELPKRLIDLYTYEGDVVLDPFMGSGTTAISALRAGRHYLGYDTDEAYIELATERIEKVRAELNEKVPDLLTARPHLTAQRAEESTTDDLQARAMRSGAKAVDLAHDLLDAAGFTAIRKNVKLSCGVEVGFVADDHKGRPWYFDVSGGFTTSRPGLRRTEAVWSAVGKASVIRESQRSAGERFAPLVLLTTDSPARNSTGDNVLRSMSEGGGSNFPKLSSKPVFETIDLRSSVAPERLRSLAAGLRPVSRHH